MKAFGEILIWLLVREYISVIFGENPTTAFKCSSTWPRRHVDVICTFILRGGVVKQFALKGHEFDPGILLFFGRGSYQFVDGC